jgi:DNA-binding transcriptional LysR family regulator
VMAPDHPLATKTAIEPDDLYKEPIITNVRNEPIHDLLGAAFGKIDLDRQVMIGTNSTITACALVMKGSGVAIVEPMGVREIFPMAVQKPFLPAVSITPRVVQARHVAPSRIARAFLNTIKETVTDYVIH